jgi:glutamyl endopeptidase
MPITTQTVVESHPFSPEASKSAPNTTRIESRNLPAMRSPIPESVIGVDDRTPAGSTTTFPGSAVVDLEVDFPAGSYACTGFMVGPNTIVTAGHCVHYLAFGGFATRILAYPGRDGDTAPFGVFQATNWYVSSRWIESGNKPKFDYGAITIGSDLSDTVGYFGFARNDNSNWFIDRVVKIWGYPGDKQYGTQWRMKGTVKKLNQSRLFYAIDTAGGQSGSPVFNKMSGSCKPCAFGVHTYGVAGNWELNSATRFNSKAIDFICAVRGGC